MVVYRDSQDRSHRAGREAPLQQTRREGESLTWLWSGSSGASGSTEEYWEGKGTWRDREKETRAGVVYNKAKMYT